MLIIYLNTSLINADNSWITTYTDNLGNYKTDVAKAMVIDSKGSVYVTGDGYGQDTCSDIMTIKFDKSGKVKWIQKDSNPTNLNNFSADIALDKSDNIYVAGTSYLSELESDIVIIKYNSNGKKIWTARYHRPEYGYYLCEAEKILIDSFGNVYVTGTICNPGASYDYLIIKYNSFGFEEWVRTYNGVGNGDDQPVGIVTDATGNIYITGFSVNKNFGYDITTIKYDLQGNQKWVSRYNSNPNRLNIEDVPYDIDIDEESNLYITGYDKSGFTKDITTLKIDANGNIQWTANYQGNGGDDDIATAVAVDNKGSAYVTGYTYNLGTDYDYTTIKYNTAGQMLWVKTYNGAGNYQDFANDIALDKYGDVYITGKSNGRIKSYTSDSTSEIVTSKYSTTGDSIWTARYSKGSTNNGIQIKTDNKDNVYVLGYINPINIARSYILIKYAQRRY